MSSRNHHAIAFWACRHSTPEEGMSALKIGRLAVDVLSVWLSAARDRATPPLAGRPFCFAVFFFL